ncbi:MAG TPA: FecR domain-containing protein [Puia sp.]|nr:FecR domain-containing protein [Puia sp.]
MENPDDQTKKLLQDEQAYTERPEDIRQLADAIWSDISTRLDTGSTDTAEAPVRRWRLAGPIAASTTGLLIIIAAITWQTHRSHHSAQSQSVPAVANLLVRQDLDRVNQTDRSQTVYLVDGSKVVLQPGAGIRHAAFLQKDKREVYLQGNAFFEVAKDARRPFYVYSGDLVVRVLGTSFKVATDKESGDITVLVTTGKVAVTRKTAPLPQPLILTTNQIAFYKGHSRDLVQLKAEKKDLTPDLIPTAPAISFNFDETPVEDIFQTLENAYGIPFHYDKATFSHCVLTTSLADESLEEKIRIICEAIGATYELKEDGIFLEGKPCK